jgi:hypothetical protein
VHNKHIEQLEHYELTKYDVVVSNPPFNLKNNGNKKFLKHVVDHSINQGLIILYKPPIKTREEIKYMQHLLDKNLLHRIIYNPDRLFTSTTTITSILEIRHNKQNTSLYLQDCTYYKSEKIRHQNGQFGGNSHTNKTYHKKFNCYDDEHIERIANIWRGPRTIKWSTNQIKAEEIPLNLMIISNPIGLLYEDSDEIQKALDEKQKVLDEKQKKEYQEAVMKMARALLSVDLAKEEMRKKLERDYVAVLDAYLRVIGLNDYELTEDDKKILSLSAKRASDEDGTLEDNSEDEVKFGKVKVSKLFDIHPTSAYKMSNSDLFATIGDTPVLSNSSANNGIGGYSVLEPTENGNIITFSDTTTGPDTMFYQPNPFIGYAHVQGMYPLQDGWSEASYEYFIGALRKAAGDGWSYAVKFNRKLVADMDVTLPIKSDGTPDFGYMEHYIRAIENVVIADVVKYKDKVIEETRKDVGVG